MKGEGVEKYIGLCQYMLSRKDKGFVMDVLQD
jgi:hypothetical protein